MAVEIAGWDVFIFGYFLTALANIAHLWVVSLALPRKVKFRRFVICGLIIACGNFPKYFLGYVAPVMMCLYLFYFGYMLVYLPLTLYEGKTWQKLVINALIYFGQMVSEAITYVIMSPMYGENVMMWPMILHVQYLMLFYISYTVIETVFIAISRFFKGEQFRSYYLLFFGYLLTVWLLCFNYVLNVRNTFWSMGMVLGLVSEFIMAYYITDFDKKQEMEQELVLARRTRELESEHYRMVEEQKVKMNSLRESYMEQLSAIRDMIDAGNVAAAESGVQSLTQDMKSTRARRWCEIPVVNAIIDQKAAECQEKGIKLDVSLDMPTEVPVEPIHLCSIFSNLLDNAIKASSSGDTMGNKFAGDRNPEEPEIHLVSFIEGDYLIIRMKNAVHNEVHGKGHGLKILKKLAEMYHGDFLHEQKGEMYLSLMSLCLVPQESEK